MCLDAFGCNRTRLRVLGDIWTLPKISVFFENFRSILLMIKPFWISGAKCYAKIRVQGLIVSEANYSAHPLRVSKEELASAQESLSLRSSNYQQSQEELQTCLTERTATQVELDAARREVQTTHF